MKKFARLRVGIVLGIMMVIGGLLALLVSPAARWSSLGKSWLNSTVVGVCSSSSSACCVQAAKTTCASLTLPQFTCVDPNGLVCTAGVTTDETCGNASCVSGSSGQQCNVGIVKVDINTCKATGNKLDCEADFGPGKYCEFTLVPNTTFTCACTSGYTSCSSGQPADPCTVHSE